MNFIFISPNFPPRYFKWVEALKDHGFPFTVSGTSSALPQSLTLTKEGATYLTDYDFFIPNSSGEDGYLSYSAVVKASFGGTLPEDQGVSFVSEDPLKAKIIPYSYDTQTGASSFQDEAGQPACRVQGYRNSGDVKIKALANANADITSEITLPIIGAPATAMSPELVEKCRQKCIDAGFQEVQVYQACPTNSYHAGPGVIGIHFYTDGAHPVEPYRS